MNQKPYHDDDVYIDDDFDNDFDEDFPPSKSNTAKPSIDSGNKEEVNLSNKINYKTDTSNFNPMEYELISPEEAEKERLNELKNSQNSDYADPIFGQAVSQIEDKLGRKITYDEFDKLCKTYAAELTNRDAEIRNTDPNPIDYKMYYETLIQNKKVQPAYVMRMQNYENSLVSEIDSLLEKHKQYDERDMNIKLGDSVNIRHKGKVVIRDESKNREYIINNKKDVELLHMKYREDWLNKRFGNQIDSENGEFHSNDGFE